MQTSRSGQLEERTGLQAIPGELAYIGSRELEERTHLQATTRELEQRIGRNTARRRNRLAAGFAVF